MSSVMQVFGIVKNLKFQIVQNLKANRVSFFLIKEFKNRGFWLFQKLKEHNGFLARVLAKNHG
jgi:hypothetical protein